MQSSIVEKCVAVMDLLARSSGRLTQSEIAAETEFNKSSTHRILSILMGQKLVQFDERDRTYSVGTRLVGWARAAWEKMDLSLIDDQDLADLSAQTGMNVALSVLTENTVTFIRTRIAHPYRLAVKTGGQSELYNTAAGKTFLAYMEEDRLEAYLEQAEMERITQTTITTRDALEADLKDIRARGFAISNREEFYQVVGIAAPVLDYDRRIVAAISIWVPLRAASFDQLLDQAPTLLSLVDTISGRFGQMTLQSDEADKAK